jgi:hypothetical protein
MTTTTGIQIHVPSQNKLPDDAQWENRFEIRSETSDRKYVVSQNKTKRFWGCSCMGWRRYRTCKHLNALSLPAHEQPYEAKLS